MVSDGVELAFEVQRSPQARQETIRKICAAASQYVSRLLRISRTRK